MALLSQKLNLERHFIGHFGEFRLKNREIVPEITPDGAIST